MQHGNAVMEKAASVSHPSCSFERHWNLKGRRLTLAFEVLRKRLIVLRFPDIVYPQKVLVFSVTTRG